MNSKQLPHFFEADTVPLLFHFTSAHGALGIINSECLWLTDYSMMEDQQEYQYSKDCYLRAYRNRLAHISETPRLLNTFNLLDLESNTRILIACLTKDHSSSSHWRKYAIGETGCAIGIHSRYLQNEAGVAIRTVQYDDAYIESFCNAGWTMLEDEYQKGGPSEDWHVLSKMFVSDLYAFKKPDFAAEAEIRISRMIVVANGNNFQDVGGETATGERTKELKIRYRETHQGSAPYIELPLRSDMTGLAIKELHIGSACEEESRREIIAAANAKSVSIVIHQL